MVNRLHLRGTGQFVFSIVCRLRHISRRARLLRSPWLPAQTCTSVIPLTPQGKPLLRKRLRRGRLQSVSDCRGFRPSKQKPPSGSKALCFLPASGRSSAPAAPALRQASGRALRARPHGSRDDCVYLLVAVSMIAAQSIHTHDDCANQSTA